MADIETTNRNKYKNAEFSEIVNNHLVDFLHSNF